MVEVATVAVVTAGVAREAEMGEVETEGEEPEAVMVVARAEARTEAMVEATGEETAAAAKVVAGEVAGKEEAKEVVRVTGWGGTQDTRKNLREQRTFSAETRRLLPQPEHAQGTGGLFR